MSNISVTNINDGDAVTAASVNNQINTIVNDYNGNIGAVNLAANAVTTTAVAEGGLTLSKIANASEFVFDFVNSGCVWSADSAGASLNGSMTSGAVYINGVRAAVTTVTAHAFTASKDTYIDVGSTGTLTYTEVANNAASPALAASNIRLAIVVTGVNIAAATSINQGQENRALPIASSIPYAVTDSLGNLICPRDPNRKTLGYRQSVTAQNAIGADVMLTGLVVPVIVPTGRKILVTASVNALKGATAGANVLTIRNGTTTAAASVGLNNTNTALGTRYKFFAVAPITPPSASQTYGLSFTSSGSNSDVANDVDTGYIRVELV